MAKAKSRAKAKRPDPRERWISLTWQQVGEWTGSRSVARGKAYQRQERVEDLAIAEDGRLLATVVGTERYATSAWRIEEGEGAGGATIRSRCTCPVGADGCKHAVATVVACLDAIGDDRPIPIADPDDPRWGEIAELEGAIDDWDEDEDEKPPKPARLKPGKGTAGGDAWGRKIEAEVRSKSREELANLVLALVGRFPELRAEFRERIELREGGGKELIAQARAELRKVTSEAGWRNRWDDEGHTPDYSRLMHRLERLVEMGHADDVVKLGRELIVGGLRQASEAADDGETSSAFAECLPVVFQAVLESGLSDPEKILFAIDAVLEDDYGIVEAAAEPLLDTTWDADDWSEVADGLQGRLRKLGRGTGRDDFSRDYARDRLVDWLLEALDCSGRSDEAIAICEAEARETNSYQRLVDRLIGLGRIGDAERWAREGIARTRERWPGISAQLAESLAGIARDRKDWKVAAAHAADRFFDRPDPRKFRELIDAAAKAKCKQKVRAAALEFLETGVAPIRTVDSGKGKLAVLVDDAWPLPVPEELMPSTTPRRWADAGPRPHLDVLLDMAIEDKQIDDVIRWYEKLEGSPKEGPGDGGWPSGGYGHHGNRAERVAEAVAPSHPEYALGLYRKRLDRSLGTASGSAYQESARLLRKIRGLLERLDRAEEWAQLLGMIRAQYRRRPNFMEILDQLEGGTIVDALKAGRGRS